MTSVVDRPLQTMSVNNCDNCAGVIGPLGCEVHGSGANGQACDAAIHYYGSSPREFPNASKGEPAILCGICDRLLRGHRGAALVEREGW